MMIFCTYIQVAGRAIVHEGAHTKPIAYKHLNPYLRQDPELLFVPSLGFPTSKNVVESAVSALWAVGRVRLSPRAEQSQIQGGSYLVPSMGMLLDCGPTQGCPCALQKLSPVPGGGSWGTTHGPWGQTPTAEVFKVARTVQTLGLGAAPRSDLMVTGLEQHCLLCQAGSVPGLPHLNHALTQDDDMWMMTCPVPCSFLYATLVFPTHRKHSSLVMRRHHLFLNDIWSNFSLVR